ncbi:hypothetical protein J2861_005363 [Agrobacterium tumefaciens]|nr:hypothetical protein [Agrobacterium tumefaciens]MDP9791347.1 hypothetical protein [Agrobacterium tumefaciens]MDP9855273.1 hypothetical protein [Agrobacterium tumefaciens]
MNIQTGIRVAGPYMSETPKDASLGARFPDQDDLIPQGVKLTDQEAATDLLEIFLYGK